MKTENLWILVGLTDLDKLIDTRLKEAGIVLTLKSSPEESVLGMQEHFENELLARHALTMKEFIRYAFLPLRNVLSKVDSDSIPEDYLAFIVMIGGYSRAFENSNTKDMVEKFGERSMYWEKLNKIFSYKEFQEMLSVVKELIPELEKKALVCKQDFLKDRSKEKQNLQFAKEFVKELVGAKSEEKIAQLSGQIDTSVMADMFFENSRNKLLGVPIEKLMITLSKLFGYWEVLHHAGYMNISPTDEQSMNWIKYF